MRHCNSILILIILLVFFSNATRLAAQTDDDNVIITNSSIAYSFEEDNGSVKIKEKKETYYEATKKGKTHHTVEFYSDQVSLDKVSVKKKYGDPQYKQYSSDDMFYTDVKVCNISLSLDRKGSTSEVKVEKTYRDPRYFTTVYFPEVEFIKERTISLSVPFWVNVQIIEHNFGKNINKEVITDEKNKRRVYTYTITNEPAIKSESNMRGRSHIYPHIQVLVKSSRINGEKQTYFETLNDQYAWYHNIVKKVNNDKAIIAAKAKDITKDCKTENDKVRSLFAWVQENIRYLAFEDGIAAFKPDDAQEVLKKKYGDCKGMSNLLKALLEAEGFDARLAWLGTNHIAYGYENPSLSADNHMICALFFKGEIYYLDPTVKYMPMGESPKSIQGRQTLVEDKDKSKYLLKNIPVFSPVMNTDSTFCEYTISDNALQGKCSQYYMGESKQLIMSLMDATPKDKLNESIEEFLSKSNSQDKVSNINLKGLTSQSNKVEMNYEITNRSSIQNLDKEYYIDLEHGKNFIDFTVDTDKRVNDIDFRYRHHTVNNIVLHIPSGYKVTYLPPALNIVKDSHIFKTEYKHVGNKIYYTKTISILADYLPKERFEEWNSDISKLKKAYMEQLVLTNQ